MRQKNCSQRDYNPQIWNTQWAKSSGSKGYPRKRKSVKKGIEKIMQKKINSYIALDLPTNKKTVKKPKFKVKLARDRGMGTEQGQA